MCICTDSSAKKCAGLFLGCYYFTLLVMGTYSCFTPFYQRPTVHIYLWTFLKVLSVNCSCFCCYVQDGKVSP